LAFSIGFLTMYAQDYSMVISVAVVAVVALLGGAVAVAANVLYRSTQSARDVATLRILGARRPHFFRAFLIENAAGVLLGISAGILVLASVATLWRPQGLIAVLVGAAFVIGAATLGCWLGARHAARTPFEKSGLFSTAPDRRGA
jgi:predicted lysophospholipase L1 biosynthesis ABC-type transport system permease subunit